MPAWPKDVSESVVESSQGYIHKTFECLIFVLPDIKEFDRKENKTGGIHVVFHLELGVVQHRERCRGRQLLGNRTNNERRPYDRLILLQVESQQSPRRQVQRLQGRKRRQRMRLDSGGDMARRSVDRTPGISGLLIRRDRRRKRGGWRNRLLGVRCLGTLKGCGEAAGYLRVGYKSIR